MPDLLGGSSYIKSRGAGDAYLLPLELYWGNGVGCELQREGGLTNIGRNTLLYFVRTGCL